MKKDIQFDLEERIFFMKNNKVMSAKVVEIRVDKKGITYYCILSGGMAPHPEYIGRGSTVFATKRELIESL